MRGIAKIYCRKCKFRASGRLDPARGPAAAPASPSVGRVHRWCRRQHRRNHRCNPEVLSKHYFNDAHGRGYQQLECSAPPLFCNHPHSQKRYQEDEKYEQRRKILFDHPLIEARRIRRGPRHLSHSLDDEVVVGQQIEKEEAANQRKRNLSNSLAMILIGTPLYLYHWKTIKKENK